MFCKIVQIMEYRTDKKEEITRKIVQLIDNSSLFINHDLEILDCILNKYKFKTIPNYSKETGKSKSGLYAKIGKDDFPHKIIDNIAFVIPDFI